MVPEAETTTRFGATDDSDLAAQSDLEHPSVDLAGNAIRFHARLSEGAIRRRQLVADDPVFPTQVFQTGELGELELMPALHPGLPRRPLRIRNAGS